MTITRQRWIMRELSPGTFKRFTTVDKEITWMMFSHFCFHYLNGILGHFFIAFCMFLFVTPKDLEEICQFGFVWNMIGKIFSVTLSLFRYFFSISRLQRTILISNIQLLTCCYPFEKNTVITIQKQQFNKKKEKISRHHQNVWIMHVALTLAFIAKSFLRITIF